MDVIAPVLVVVGVAGDRLEPLAVAEAIARQGLELVDEQAGPSWAPADLYRASRSRTRSAWSIENRLASTSAWVITWVWNGVK